MRAGRQVAADDEAPRRRENPSRAELALVAQGYGVRNAVCFTTWMAETPMFSGELGITMAAALGRRTYATATSSVLAARDLVVRIGCPSAAQYRYPRGAGDRGHLAQKRFA